MPLDTNGVYSLPNGYRATSGDDILPSQHNPPLEDIASTLSQMFVRDGRAPATGNWNMNDNKMTGLADGTDPQDAATVGQAAYAVGDFKSSANNLGEKWLRRNGAIYNRADWPELADVLPSLPDTINFTSVYAPGTFGVRDFAQDSTRIVAVVEKPSNLYEIITSTDNGLTWSTAYSATGDCLYGIVKTATGWCAFGSRNPSGTTYNFLTVTSTDGLSWTAVQQSTTYRYLPNTGNRHTYNGTALIVGVTRSSDGNPFIARSADNGATWTYAASPLSFHGAIVSSPSRTVILDNTNAIVSLDQGVTFGTPTASNIGSGQVGTSAYDSINSKMALGQDGKLRFSTDGITWSTVTLSESGLPFNLSAGAIGVIVKTNTKLFVCANSTSVISFSAPTGAGLAVLAHKTDASLVLVANTSQAIYRGVRTSPTQFQVPSDDPTYGWIKAKP